MLTNTQREMAQLQAKQAESNTEAVRAVVSTHESAAELLDKALALLSTKGPLEFQAVQAMNGAVPYTEDTRFDPSDEGEIERIEAMTKGAGYGDDDQLDPEAEVDFLRAIGAPGLEE